MDPHNDKVEFMRRVAEEARAISDKTKTGNFWWRDGALRLEKVRLAREVSVWTLSAASSTYYAAAGNAGARAKKNPLWLLPAIWCLIRSRLFSNELKRLNGNKLDGLDPAVLDIRASICGKCWFWPGSHEEQFSCLEKAIDHPDCPVETEALLCIQFGEIRRDNDVETAEGWYEDAFKLFDQVSPLTQVRMFRSRARFYRRLKKYSAAVEDLEEAQQLAGRNKLHDQVQKIDRELAAFYL